ncbi:MAG: hypothetical protein ACP5TY_10875 [Thermodesulforhabdaceae bacterium]|jgi:hypothetical protein
MALKKHIFIFLVITLLGISVLNYARSEEKAAEASDPIVDNNLFAPDRSPRKASSQNVETPQASPSDLQLDGILFWGDKKFAVFKVNTQALAGEEKTRKSPYVTVPEGGQIGSYRVVSIQKAQVVVEQGGQQTTIPLVRSTKQPPPISVPLPVVPAQPVKSPTTPSATPVPQPFTGEHRTEPQPSTPPNAQDQQPAFAPSQESEASGEQPSSQMSFPSPEEFEKLSPEQKEEVVNKMRSIMGAKLKTMKKQ